MTSSITTVTWMLKDQFDFVYLNQCLNLTDVCRFSRACDCIKYRRCIFGGRCAHIKCVETLRRVENDARCPECRFRMDVATKCCVPQHPYCAILRNLFDIL